MPYGLILRILGPLLLVLGLVWYVYGKGQASVQQRWDAQIAADTLLAREQEARDKEAVALLKKARDHENEATNARLVAALGELRKRPDRLPVAAAAACQGTTGAELSGPDSAVLAGIAARADKLRSALAECYGWADQVGKQ